VNRRVFLELAALSPFTASALAASRPAHEQRADVAIIGGGCGGCAAALAAARAGCTVILTEETDWIGGQLTHRALQYSAMMWSNVELVRRVKFMQKTIEIVDRGRGPQLSASRITVQDLVPYLRRHWSHEQIMEIMPSLTIEEIQAVERYVQENYEAVMEQDRRIRERTANRKNPPEIEEILRRGRAKMERVRQELAGFHHRRC
jgi:NADPH-dependent 2,4-dienoyl-CoA reductase/sulfur reductase-like enzyme